MKLGFLFVGRAKNPHLAALESEYLKKISHYLPISHDCLKDGLAKSPERRCQDEGVRLLARIDPNDFVIVADQNGRPFDTERLARQFAEWMNRGFKKLFFVVGGAYGLDESVKQRAQLMLSLATLTLPHELARVILLEQVYRCQTLLRGEKYHH